LTSTKEGEENKSPPQKAFEMMPLLLGDGARKRAGSV
jgi:hypothetical protein